MWQGWMGVPLGGGDQDFLLASNKAFPGLAIPFFTPAFV